MTRRAGTRWPIIGEDDRITPEGEFDDEFNNAFDGSRTHPRSSRIPSGPWPPQGDGRTIDRDDILAATTIQLFGGNLRQQALTEAREATQNTSTG